MFKFLILLPIFFTANVFGEIKICMEDTQWIPLIYTSPKNLPTGIIVDITETTLKKINVKYSLNILPWKRCLQYVKDGIMDSALGASYNSERALYMDYPEGAKLAARNGNPADFRIIQTDYVVVNLISQKFKYTGDIQVIPTPIYVPSGYSIGFDLRKMGLDVDSQGKQDVTNFQKLEKRKNGSIIVIRPLAERYIQENKKNSVFKISTKSFKSKSSFFTFSKKSKVTKLIQNKIWNAIKKVRETEAKSIILKY